MKAISLVTFTERDSWVMGFGIRESDGTTPLDLTGASVTWKLAYGYEQGALVTAEIDNGITVVSNPANGNIDVNVSPAMHASIVAGNYVHQVDVTLADETASTQIQGPFKVIEAI